MKLGGAIGPYWAVWALGVLGYAVYRSWRDGSRRQTAELVMTRLAFASVQRQAMYLLEEIEGLRHATYLGGREGVYNGCKALVADYRIKIGKGSYDQTYLAVERRSNQAVPFRSTLEVSFRQIEDWTIASIPKHTINESELEGYLQLLT